MWKSCTIAAFLCLVAVALTASLTQFRTNTIVTYRDGSVARTIVGDPFVETGWSVADTFCAMRAPCKVASVGTIRGLYPRKDVPRLLVILLGIALPFAMFCSSGAIFGATLTGVLRIRVGVAVLSAGVLLLVPGALTLMLAPRFYVAGTLAYDHVSAPPLLLATASSFVLIVGGFWLAFGSPPSRDEA